MTRPEQRRHTTSSPIDGTAAKRHGGRRGSRPARIPGRLAILIGVSGAAGDRGSETLAPEPRSGWLCGSLVRAWGGVNGVHRQSEDPDQLTERGHDLLDRYETGGEVGNLRAAVDAYERALGELTTGDEPWTFESNLGNALRLAYERLGERALLDRSVAVLRAAAARLDGGRIGRSSRTTWRWPSGTGRPRPARSRLCVSPSCCTRAPSPTRIGQGLSVRATSTISAGCTGSCTGRLARPCSPGRPMPSTRPCASRLPTRLICRCAWRTWRRRSTPVTGSTAIRTCSTRRQTQPGGRWRPRAPPTSTGHASSADSPTCWWNATTGPGTGTTSPRPSRCTARRSPAPAWVPPVVPLGRRTSAAPCSYASRPWATSPTSTRRFRCSRTRSRQRGPPAAPRRFSTSPSPAWRPDWASGTGYAATAPTSTGPSRPWNVRWPLCRARRSTRRTPPSAATTSRCC